MRGSLPAVMLRVLHQATPGYCPVTHRATAERLFARVIDGDDDDAEEEERDAQETVHVSHLNATEEASVRMLDAVTRTAFPLIPYNVNTVHILSACAGAGKTTANINLAKNLIAENPLSKVAILTFNKCAQIDGSSRTKGIESIAWRTIDSVIWDLYKHELEETDVIETADAASVRTMAQKILNKPVTIHDIEVYLKQLDSACTTGNGTLLHGDARLLYEAGLRGEWWSYAVLRVRALTNSDWVTSMDSYDCIMVDEGQDLNPIMIELLKLLHPHHMMVYTRDKAQKIYSFMLCEDITEHLPPDSYTSWQLYLTFRYGMTLCNLINRKQLADCVIFPHSSVSDTTVHQIEDEYIIPGPHVYLVSTWKAILEKADKLLNAGRAVGIDAEKKTSMLTAAAQKEWSRYDAYLFKHMGKHRVIDILSRCISEGDELSAQRGNITEPAGIVVLTTIFGYKGLEGDVIRISRCVLQQRDGADDFKERLYVAMTRAKKRLYVPSEKTAVGNSKKRKNT